MAELGAPRQRAAAAAGADALAAAGVTDPPWLPELTAVRHTGSWAHGDVYGDQTNVLLAFEAPARPHGLVVLVDHTLDGIAKDAFVTGDVAGVLADLRSLREPTTWIRDLTPEEAAALLVPAFAATDAGRDLPLGEDLRETRALAVARLRLLPAPGEEEPRSAEDPAALAAEFLDATGPLPDVDPTDRARCARLVADGMAAIDGRPARASPSKIDLLYDLLADRLDPDDAAWAALQPVVAAWGRMGRPPGRAARRSSAGAGRDRGRAGPRRHRSPGRAGRRPAARRRRRGDGSRGAGGDPHPAHVRHRRVTRSCRWRGAGPGPVRSGRSRPARPRRAPRVRRPARRPRR
jgi:hypothetical protein